jgi:hypothetical protein
LRQLRRLSQQTLAPQRDDAAAPARQRADGAG